MPATNTLGYGFPYFEIDDLVALAEKLLSDEEIARLAASLESHGVAD
jgi:hypothetical protein